MPRLGEQVLAIVLTGKASGEHEAAADNQRPAAFRKCEDGLAVADQVAEETSNFHVWNLGWRRQISRQNGIAPGEPLGRYSAASWRSRFAFPYRRSRAWRESGSVGATVAARHSYSS